MQKLSVQTSPLLGPKALSSRVRAPHAWSLEANGAGHASSYPQSAPSAEVMRGAGADTFARLWLATKRDMPQPAADAVRSWWCYLGRTNTSSVK